MATLKNGVETIAKDRLRKPCPVGFYRSEFLFGNCAECPEFIIRCKDQQSGDDRRCQDACVGKTVLSTTPTTAPTMRRMPTPATTTTLSTKESAIRTIVTGKPKSTRPKTENLQKSFSQIFSEVSSERKAAEEITSSRTKKNESSDHNIMIIGVSCTAGALFLPFIVLLGFLIKQRKTQRNSAVNQVSLPNSSYVVVATESNSNEDIPSFQTASNVEQAEVDEENSWDLPTSLSRSALNNLAETTL